MTNSHADIRALLNLHGLSPSRALGQNFVGDANTVRRIARLAEVGAGTHAALRGAGVAVRRADTFPGLGPTWVRIAVRPPERTRSLLDALSALHGHALG